MFKTHNFWIVILFFVAFVIRLYAVTHITPQEKIPRSDAQHYDEIATNIVEGNGFMSQKRLTASREPIYPLFLASIYKLCGHNYEAVHIIQSLISASLCVFIFFIAQTIFDKKIAYLACICSIIYMPFIHYEDWSGPGWLLTEVLFTFLLSVCVYLSLLYEAKRTLITKIILGILLGVTVQTKGSLILFIPFLILWIFCLRDYLIKDKLKDIFLILTFFLLALTPWTLRNYFIFNDFVFVSTNGGHVFFASNHPLASGGWVREKSAIEKEPNYKTRYTEVEISKAKFREAVHYLMTHSGRIPYLLFKKTIAHWSFFNENGSYNIYYGLALLLGCLGIIFSLSHLNPGNILLLFTLFWSTLLAMTFYGLPRFRIPCEPYLIIFASYGIIKLFTLLQKRSLALLALVCIISSQVILFFYSHAIFSFLRQVIA